MNRPWRHTSTSLAVLLVLVLSASGGSRAQSYLDEIARAAALESVAEGLIVSDLKVGSGAAGSNDLSLTVSNQSENVRHVILRVEVFPGLGGGKFDHADRHIIEPHATKDLSSTYCLRSLTPFSRLTVTVETEGLADNGEVRPIQAFRSRIFLGINNPAVELDLPGFKRQSSQHIDGYVVPGSLAENEIDGILTVRESAIARIGDIVGLSYRERIKLFLFPNENLKRQHTGHNGLGWAHGDFIAEVYNKDEKLDPYHELAHILAGQLGRPPAFLDEGFATYISEEFGEDALKYLGAPGRSVDEVSADFVRSGMNIPLFDLVAIDDIGSSADRARIAYPQSASLTKYLINIHGYEKFRSLFGALEISAGQDSTERNMAALRHVLGYSLEELEGAWISWLLDNG